MKKILKTVGRAVQIVLAAPIKLPAKVVQVTKYIALVLGILEATIPDDDKKKQEEESDHETAD